MNLPYEETFESGERSVDDSSSGYGEEESKLALNPARRGNLEKGRLTLESQIMESSRASETCADTGGGEKLKLKRRYCPLLPDR